MYIFCCNAKPLTLGRRVGLDPQRDHFVLEIANTKPCAPNMSQWNIHHVGSGIGHVDFMLFVSIHLRGVANANAISDEQGCQFSDFSLISDFFENKGNGHTKDKIWSKHGQSLNSNQRQA